MNYSNSDLFDSITTAIISCINGVSVPIELFEYAGCFSSREDVPKGRKGIYVFTVTKEVPLSKEMIRDYNNAMNWNNTAVGAGFNNPCLDCLHPGDVYYLGKVASKSNSVYQRLKVHFGGRTDSATNGIKMKMPERHFIDGKLVVQVFFFEKGNEDYYVINEVEKRLHERLCPKTGGKQ